MAAWRRTEYPRDKGACYRLVHSQLSALMEGELGQTMAFRELSQLIALVFGGHLLPAMLL